MYLVMKDAGIAVPLRSLLDDLEAKATKLDRMIHDIRQFFKKDAVAPDISNDIKFSLQQLPTLKNDKEMLKRAKDILECIDVLGLATGRHRKSVYLSAAYYAHESDKKNRGIKPQRGPPNGKKINMGIKNFLKKNNEESCYNSVEVLASHLRQRFIILAKRLPWVTADDKVGKLYLYYIDDVVKHKDYLIQEVCHPKDLSKSVEIYVNNEGKQGVSGSRHGKFGTVPDAQLIAKASSEVENQLKPPEDDTPRKTYPTASTSLLLDERDIPDEELPKYILSPEEVKVRQAIHRKLEQSQQQQALLAASQAKE